MNTPLPTAKAALARLAAAVHIRKPAVVNGCLTRTINSTTIAQ